MEIELSGWWLGALLAVVAGFFAAGWFARGFDLRHLIRETRDVPAVYFSGLNYLLNDQQDKAIGAFLQVAREHPQTAQLQFALGNLFRRRGEIDQALRMHQDLTQRSDLSAEDRQTAQLELARDYLRAGLLEHAARAVDTLAQTSSTQGMRLLLEIRVLARDWVKAAEVAARLGRATGESRAREVSHYLCEAALAASTEGRQDEASHWRSEAMRADPQAVRPRILEAEAHAAHAQHQQAIDALTEIEATSPDHAGLTARLLMASYRALGREREGLAQLRALQQRQPSLELLELIDQALLELEGEPAAHAFVREAVRQHPTLVGLDKLIEAELRHQPGQRAEDLTLMRQLVHAHASALSVFLCSGCGFRARDFHWRCPACGGWETLPPKRTAELENPEKQLARLTIGQQRA
jgi:lipopolysaccharide biosynthesis regulator YciM